MKMYYTEDRSAGHTGADASPRVNNIIQLFELTDWSPEDMDEITNLAIGQEWITKDRAVYVKRLV